MILKHRYETEELKLLRYLNIRMQLTSKNYTHYVNLEKGFTGEKQFDKLLQSMPDESFIINDLLLEYSNTIFQIDSLLITGDCIYVFEIKNYEGDFYIDHDKWSTTSKSEIKNPLLQLQRSESLLRRLLLDLGFNAPIKSYLIFINPEFYLYQASLNLPAVFPAQLNRFLLKLKAINSKEKHLKLAEKLISLNLKETPFAKKPEYTFEELEKGITCEACQQFMKPLHKSGLVCRECGCKEDIDSAILRSTEEFRVLFPEMKISTNSIHEWCKVIQSKKRIRRTLANNFKHITNGKSSYFDPCR